MSTETDRLQRITTYQEKVGIPTRKSSEENLRPPTPEAASSATRDMSRDISSFTSKLLEFGFEQLQTASLASLLSEYQSMLRGVGYASELELHQLARIEFTDSPEETLASIIENFPENSIPYILASKIMNLSQMTGISLQEATQYCMRYLSANFPRMSSIFENARIAEADMETASRLAVGVVLREIDDIAQTVAESTQPGESISKALSANFTSAGKMVETPEEGQRIICLSRLDYEGLVLAYKIQRRYADRDELTQAQQLLEANERILKSMLIMQILFSKYAKMRLVQEPSRLQHTLEHFNSMFLARIDEMGAIHTAPNPKFITTMVHNWMGAIARLHLQLDSDPDNLSGETIREAIELAGSDLSIFNMKIGLFEPDSENPDRIIWRGIIGRVCPAKSMITQTASALLPLIYQKLTN